jgi:anti-sigma B factor antagonist
VWLWEVVGIDIRLETRSEGSWTVVEVGGEIDLFSAPQLKERIARLVDEGTPRLVVNLEKVDFMDSTGLGVLLGALKRVRERDGSLAIVCPPGPVHRVLTLTGLHKVFSVYESLADVTS